MGNSEEEDRKLLAKSVTVNLIQQFCCFQDHTCPPQFKDVNDDVDETVEEEIKQRFKDLSDQLNQVLQEEYECEDRKELGQKLNIFYPLLTFLTLAMTLCGIYMLITHKNRTGLIVMFYVMCTLCGVICVMTVCFFCCLGGSGFEEDERLNEKANPVVENWNSTNQHSGVVAEFKEEHFERRGKNNVEIPPSLYLWKKGEFESEPLV
eukprot:GFUD01013222.1.p1 GENE.GFUD01013222.1~~GFUD01013222.1.p1  ORF type:complete len:219 (+),score=47.07 GFUD01013222.1:39-659(+)